MKPLISLILFFVCLYLPTLAACETIPALDYQITKTNYLSNFNIYSRKNNIEFNYTLQYPKIPLEKTLLEICQISNNHFEIKFQNKTQITTKQQQQIYIKGTLKNQSQDAPYYLSFLDINEALLNAYQINDKKIKKISIKHKDNHFYLTKQINNSQRTITLHIHNKNQPYKKTITCTDMNNDNIIDVIKINDEITLYQGKEYLNHLYKHYKNRLIKTKFQIIEKTEIGIIDLQSDLARQPIRQGENKDTTNQFFKLMETLMADFDNLDPGKISFTKLFSLVRNLNKLHPDII